MSRPRPQPINRRTFLRGASALIALPFLDAMMPQSANAQSAAIPKRLGTFYFPFGTYNQAWEPASFGTNFNIPQNLAPLAPYKSRIILTRGLGAHKLPQGSHQGSAPYFIGEPTPGCAFRVEGKTADIMISDYIRLTNPTILPLITTISDAGLSSGCGSHGGYEWEAGMSDYLSWNNSTSAASQMKSPRQVFDKLFSGLGTVTPVADPMIAFRRARGLSVLDAILGQANSLIAKVGAADKQKVDQYFTSIREVERTIQSTSPVPMNPAFVCKPGARPESDLPHDVAMLAFIDLVVLAMACDVTRVATHFLDSDSVDRRMPWLDLGHIGSHHVSHFSQDIGGVAPANKPPLFLKTTNWYASRMAYLLGKMQSYKEGDHDLLYNSLIVYGSGMGPNGESHDNVDIPVVLAGELGGTIRTGQAIDLSGTRMSNLWLTVMQKFGLNASKYLRSTGTINLG